MSDDQHDQHQHEATPSPTPVHTAPLRLALSLEARLFADLDRTAPDALLPYGLSQELRQRLERFATDLYTQGLHDAGDLLAGVADGSIEPDLDRWAGLPLTRAATLILGLRTGPRE